jgi:hypothetical protein
MKPGAHAPHPVIAASPRRQTTGQLKDHGSITSPLVNLSSKSVGICSTSFRPCPLQRVSCLEVRACPVQAHVEPQLSTSNYDT